MKENPSKNNISEEASQAIEKIKNASKDLHEIQKNCPHPEYSIKNVGSIEGRSSSLRRICKECFKDIGYPSQIEIEDWSDS